MKWQKFFSRCQEIFCAANITGRILSDYSIYPRKQSEIVKNAFYAQLEKSKFPFRKNI